jgi:hypothetical protein
MTIVHVAFHIVQGLLGSFSLYALLSNTLLTAVIFLYITFAMELFDARVKELDEKVKQKTGL